VHDKGQEQCPDECDNLHAHVFGVKQGVEETIHVWSSMRDGPPASKNQRTIHKRVQLRIATAPLVPVYLVRKNTFIIIDLINNLSIMPATALQPAVIVGVDEAGRGALAGPVVAGACVLPKNFRSLPPFLQDSKQLDPDVREHAFAWICRNCTIGTGATSAEDVDTHGILWATELAMQRAVAALAEEVTPTYLLIDGRDAFWFDYPHSSIIHGDALEPCISAASIVAKVTRDRLMVAYDKEYPHYAFACHKGYGTPEHLDLVKSRGPCSIHRKTFLTKCASAPVMPDAPATTRRAHQRGRVAA